MRIGIFTNNYKPRLSGVPISIETFTKELRRMGHRVYIFAPSIRGYRDEDGDVFRLPSIPCPWDRTLALPLPWVRGVGGLVKELCLDIIHTQHPFVIGWLAARLARKNKIPLVFTHHTRYEEYAHYIPFDQRIVRRVATSLSTSYANRCDLVIVPTKQMKDILLKNGVRTWIERLPTGIELGRFEGVSSRALRQIHGLEERTRILLHVGRLAKEKNIPFLIEAFKKIAERVPSTVLVVVGYGPFEAELRKLVGKSGLGEKIILCKTDRRSDLYLYYAGAEIFLFSSLTETQGLVICEALAAGLPVVAIDSVGASEVVVDGVNGYLTENSIERFSRCVIELLMDEEKRGRFSRAARERARGFSSHLQAERLLLLYKRVIEGKRDEV
jgi:glycosyltransferase involved in cell wall biosynthesis